MATPVFCCGFECGVYGAGASAGQHWANTVGTGATINTSIVRTGARSLRTNATAGTCHGMVTLLSSQLWAIRSYVYFATLPNADSWICQTAASFIGCGIGFKNSDSSLYCARGTGGVPTAFGATGFAVTTGQWYRIDLKIDTSANPWLVNAQIDGNVLGQHSGAVAAATHNQVILGHVNSSVTFDFYHDDVLISNTLADYPLGAGSVQHFIPTSDGTHSGLTAGDFQRTLTGTDILNATTTAYQLIDDVPLESGASVDWINMVAPVASAYVECVFGPASGISTPTVPPIAVEVIAGIHQSGTGAGTMILQLNDNGSVGTIYSASGVAGVTSVAYKRAHFVDPPSAASSWTLSGNGNFNNVRVRFGPTASVDANPDQYFDCIMIEAEFPAGTEVLPAVGAIVIAGLAPTVSVTANQNITIGIGAVTIVGLAPTIQTPRNIQTDLGVILIVGLSPTVSVSDNKNITAGIGAITIVGLAPTVSVTNNQNITAGIGEVVISGLAPTIQTPRNILTDIGTVVISGLAPTVQTPVNITTDIGAITISGLEPTVQTPRNIQIDVGVITISGLEPTIQTPVNIQIDLGAVTIEGLAPTVTVSDHKNMTPGIGTVVISGLEPSVGGSVVVSSNTGEVVITGLEPTVNVTVSADTQTGTVVITGLSPTVQTPVNVITDTGVIVIAGLEPIINTGGGPGQADSLTGTIIISGLAPTVSGGAAQFLVKKSPIDNGYVKSEFGDGYLKSKVSDGYKKSKIKTANLKSTINAF